VERDEEMEEEENVSSFLKQIGCRPLTDAEQKKLSYLASKEKAVQTQEPEAQSSLNSPVLFTFIQAMPC
jgi:hypothetical protein